MKKLLAIALLLATPACLSAPGQETNHWNIESLYPRTAYHFLGYRQDIDGPYRDHQWRQKQDLNLTLRRHFLNNNPKNPFQAYDPGLDRGRPPHSVLPNPLMFFHLESLAIGAVILARTGTFIPLPLGSIFGIIEDGGPEEFVEGMRLTFSGSYGIDLDEPPPVEEFRVQRVLR